MKTRLCKYCNQPFKIPPERPWQQYCSIDCSVIGSNQSKNKAKEERLNTFYDEFAEMEIVDVLSGKMVHKGVSDRMIVKGSRNYEGNRYVVLVVKKGKE